MVTPFMATLAPVLPRLGGNFVHPRSWVRPPIATRLTWVDIVLIGIFMLGLYTNYTIMVTQKMPFPSVPSGVAGLILLWRRRDRITSRAFGAFVDRAALSGVDASHPTSHSCSGAPTV